MQCLVCCILICSPYQVGSVEATAEGYVPRVKLHVLYDMDPIAFAHQLHKSCCLQNFGCNSADHMEGKCMVVDMAEINKQAGSQGAALQRVLAKQLRVEPSSMFLMVNMHELDDSGAAVMLSLMGTRLLPIWTMCGALRFSRVFAVQLLKHHGPGCAWPCQVCPHKGTWQRSGMAHPIVSVNV